MALERQRHLRRSRHNLASIEKVRVYPLFLPLVKLKGKKLQSDLKSFMSWDLTIGLIYRINSNKSNVSFKTVLLVSTDPAHSLSDAFRSQFGAEPKSPNAADLPNLDVMEIDPSTTVQVIPTEALVSYTFL